MEQEVEWVTLELPKYKARDHPPLKPSSGATQYTYHQFQIKFSLPMHPLLVPPHSHTQLLGYLGTHEASLETHAYHLLSTSVVHKILPSDLLPILPVPCVVHIESSSHMLSSRTSKCLVSPCYVPVMSLDELPALWQ